MMPKPTNPAKLSTYQPCAWTTLPPTYTREPEPFTTTRSDGDVIACTSADYVNLNVNKQKECIGTSSTVSVNQAVASEYSASISSASVSESIASSSASAASVTSSMAAHPTSQYVIGVRGQGWGQEGYALWWRYTNQTKDWCDYDGFMEKDDISSKNLPKDIDFEDWKEASSDITKSGCKYTGTTSKAGTLECPKGTIECTTHFDAPSDATCDNMASAGWAKPKVACQYSWYGDTMIGAS